MSVGAGQGFVRPFVQFYWYLLQFVQGVAAPVFPGTDTRMMRSTLRLIDDADD